MTKNIIIATREHEMRVNNNNIEVNPQELIDKLYKLLRMPLSMISVKDGESIYCRPLAGKNNWPTKMIKSFFGSNTSIFEIEEPCIYTDYIAFYFGIIPIGESVILIGPVSSVDFSLKSVIDEFSDVFTDEEISALYYTYEDCGTMDLGRFSCIVSLFAEAAYGSIFSERELINSAINVSFGQHHRLLEENSMREKALEKNLLPELTYEKTNFSVKCENYIREHLREKIKTSDLAALFNISDRQMYREFKKFFHVTIGDYIQRARLEHAKQMIVTTDMTISEICSFWGYPSQSYFNSIFEKYMNETPGAYRRRIKNG